MAGPKVKPAPVLRKAVAAPKLAPPRPRPVGPRPKPAPPRPVGQLSGPSMAQKRKAVERQGLKAADYKLRKMGNQSVFNLQHNGLHGADKGAIRYAKNGRPLSGAVAEIKARSVRTPGPSSFKRQVRTSYYMPRLRKASEAGIKNADVLYGLAKQGKVKSLGITYGLQDKGKGARVYHVPRRGPISRKPVA